MSCDDHERSCKHCGRETASERDAQRERRCTEWRRHTEVKLTGEAGQVFVAYQGPLSGFDIWLKAPTSDGWPNVEFAIWVRNGRTWVRLEQVRWQDVPQSERGDRVGGILSTVRGVECDEIQVVQTAAVTSSATACEITVDAVSCCSVLVAAARPMPIEPRPTGLAAASPRVMGWPAGNALLSAVVLAAPGNVFSFIANNRTVGAPKFFCLFNKATALVNGDQPALWFLVSGAGEQTNAGQLILGPEFFSQGGLHFDAGIAFGWTGAAGLGSPGTFTPGAFTDDEQDCQVIYQPQTP